MNICQKIVSLLFPPKCPLCGEVTGSRIYGALCDKCRITFADNYVTICPRCNNRADLCKCAPDVVGSEYDRSPFTDVMPLIFDGYYVGYDGTSVSALVYKMKRNRKSGAAMFFAGIIATRISRVLAICNISPEDMTVTFIPRSRAAYNEYGFDHMETISKRVAEMLGCKYVSLLIRKGGTDQKVLTADERTENATKSILVNPRKTKVINSANLILLDDIITTGSTMRAAVSKLSFAGAKTIIPAAAMISITNKKRQPID